MRLIVFLFLTLSCVSCVLSESKSHPVLSHSIPFHPSRSKLLSSLPFISGNGVNFFFSPWRASVGFLRQSFQSVHVQSTWVVRLSWYEQTTKHLEKKGCEFAASFPLLFFTRGKLVLPLKKAGWSDPQSQPTKPSRIKTCMHASLRDLVIKKGFLWCREIGGSPMSAHTSFVGTPR